MNLVGKLLCWAGFHHLYSFSDYSVEAQGTATVTRCVRCPEFHYRWVND